MINGKLENHPAIMFEFSKGNEDAFDHIFKMLYSSLCLFAYRILNDQYQAEDLVQEVFVKAWHKRTNFREYSKLKSFLYLSLRNACFDELDKNKVKLKHQHTLQPAEFIDDQTVLQEIIHAEVIGRLFSVVDTLPEQCRRVIRLSFEEGKTAKEIAQELNINISTVNSQKMRGLLLLKGRLSKTDLLIVSCVLLKELMN